MVDSFLGDLLFEDFFPGDLCALYCDTISSSSSSKSSIVRLLIKFNFCNRLLIKRSCRRKARKKLKRRNRQNNFWSRPQNLVEKKDFHCMPVLRAFEPRIGHWRSMCGKIQSWTSICRSMGSRRRIPCNRCLSRA